MEPTRSRDAQSVLKLHTTTHVGNGPFDQVAARSRRMGFDRQGTGQHTLVLINDAHVLTGDAQRSGSLPATLNGKQRLKVTQPSNCQGPRLTIAHGIRLCRRISDTEAVCDGPDLEWGLDGPYLQRAVQQNMTTRQATS